MYSMSPQTTLLGSKPCGYPGYQAAKAALQQQVTETVLAFSITKYIGFRLTGDWSRWFHDDVDVLPTVTRVFICRYDFIVDTTFAIDAQLVWSQTGTRGSMILSCLDGAVHARMVVPRIQLDNHLCRRCASKFLVWSAKYTLAFLIFADAMSILVANI